MNMNKTFYKNGSNIDYWRYQQLLRVWVINDRIRNQQHLATKAKLKYGVLVQYIFSRIKVIFRGGVVST